MLCVEYRVRGGLGSQRNVSKKCALPLGCVSWRLSGSAHSVCGRCAVWISPHPPPPPPPPPPPSLPYPIHRPPRPFGPKGDTPYKIAALCTCPTTIGSLLHYVHMTHHTSPNPAPMLPPMPHTPQTSTSLVVAPAHIQRDETFVHLAGGACKRIQQILDGLDRNGYAVSSPYVIVGTGPLACSLGGCW